MTEDEKYVHDHWDRVETLMENAEYEEPWVFFTANAMYRAFRAKTSKELYAKGAEFTRTRLEQIRDVEEEIELHKDWREILSGSKRLAIWERTAERLQAALADLKRGLRVAE